MRSNTRAVAEPDAVPNAAADTGADAVPEQQANTRAHDGGGLLAASAVRGAGHGERDAVLPGGRRDDVLPVLR